MKFTKRILATLLTLALALTLALPAAAAVDWNEFRITKQPQDMTIKYGDSFTLSVEVDVPDGVEVEYQWYRGSKIEGATDSSLHGTPSDPYYPEYSSLGGDNEIFECWITAYEKDADGNVISWDRICTGSIHVYAERTALGKVYDVTIGPFGYAFTMVVMSPALAIFFPISYLGCLIYSYYLGFKGLFS